MKSVLSSIKLAENALDSILERRIWHKTNGDLRKSRFKGGYAMTDELEDRKGETNIPTLA